MFEYMVILNVPIWTPQGLRSIIFTNDVEVFFSKAVQLFAWNTKLLNFKSEVQK